MSINHWSKQAYQWSKVGAPLRPCEKDIRRFEAIIETISNEKQTSPQLNALLLGVTPEIAQLNWPSRTRLLAVDRMMEMIQEVWIPNRTIQSHTCNGNWMNLPLPNAYADIVIGDGCFTFFNFPNQYQEIIQQLKQVLNEKGYLILRLFVQGKQTETRQEVINDLLAGKIANFHVFKWRLAMSLQNTISEGVRVSDIWQAWQATGVSAEFLSKQFAWSIEEINTINAYQNSDSIYYYPSAEDIRLLLSKDFHERGFFIEDYQLAERCPIMVFQLKDE